MDPCLDKVILQHYTFAPYLLAVTIQHSDDRDMIAIDRFTSTRRRLSNNIMYTGLLLSQPSILCKQEFRKIEEMQNRTTSAHSFPAAVLSADCINE